MDYTFELPRKDGTLRFRKPSFLDFVMAGLLPNLVAAATGCYSSPQPIPPGCPPDDPLADAWNKAEAEDAYADQVEDLRKFASLIIDPRQLNQVNFLDGADLARIFTWFSQDYDLTRFTYFFDHSSAQLVNTMCRKRCFPSQWLGLTGPEAVLFDCRMEILAINGNAPRPDVDEFDEDQ